MIVPTVGRKVWYSPCPAMDDPPRVGEQPYDATIVYVWHDRLVNLRVTDHYGNTFARTSVLLLQDGDGPNPGGGHCYWMPYQVGQAAKTEEALAKVAGGKPSDPNGSY